ncbi:uncharacterized protein CANTADRAFT_25485 [Suhomyces tanzawaensis NRRL Y-17324]|uniref:ferric-chelate reductase (NADPH) n=1 Tax=Suhomyces tanzawaensis NRRL Y-17324 TaxID=984487 RepID=A0A1E4SP43_9ASCO|nr:uncharacterized protein CANTADRAFT_25485 [Suhomyces tanzawaensis NRRL Y-17324]ODV81294.1 hypothetical protein CANTADRAFT_25485 [Suhomyces tanzawaensis NRRL Y-17324]
MLLSSPNHPIQFCHPPPPPSPRGSAISPPPDPTWRANCLSPSSGSAASSPSGPFLSPNVLALSNEQINPKSSNLSLIICSRPPVINFSLLPQCRLTIITTMFGHTKRSVTFEGLDCLADTKSHEYMMARMRLQKHVPFIEQPKYGKYTVYFAVVVLFIATVKHAWFLQRDYFYKKRPSSNVGTSLVDVLVAYCRFVGYKQVPASISYFTSLPLSIGSSLFMIVSGLYMFCYCLVPHFWYRGCRGFGSPPLAVRAGIMATALTPFIYVMAGKSNMISVLTGISYEKLNVYHQYVGVSALVLSIIHTIPFIHQLRMEGGSKHLYDTVFGDFNYYSGIPPLVLLGVLCLASKSVIRKYIYETFWHLHWMAGIAYFGTLWWHINDQLGCENYMYGALGFWATQFLYRILMKTAFKPNKLFLKPRKAQLKKLNDGIFEVIIANTDGYKWQPGQHVFLRFVGSKFLDNHPFSIISMSDHDNKEMKFIILPKKGMTKVLFDQLDDFVAKEKLVYIDGPYGGTSRDPTTFERVVLLATGTGITATLPYLSFLSNHIRDVTANGKLPLITRGINFVWVIKHHEDIAWVREELERCQSVAGDYINIDIYISRDHNELPAEKAIDEKNAGESDKSAHDMETEFSVSSSAHFNIHNYKPDLRSVLNGLKVSFARRNMIVSSGSDSMRLAISSEVSKLQALVFNNDLNLNSIEEVFLHSESFGW